MAAYFNAHEIQARALDSETPNAERLRACQDLENGRLTFLFVVDLFNEGVDIPAVNTVLFLRPALRYSCSSWGVDYASLLVKII